MTLHDFKKYPPITILVFMSCFFASCSDPFSDATEILSNISNGYDTNYPDPEMIILGGDFEYANPDSGLPQQSLVAMDGYGNIRTDYFDPYKTGLQGMDWNTGIDKGVFSLELTDNSLYVAGNFDGYIQTGDLVWAADSGFSKMLQRYDSQGDLDTSYTPATVIAASNIYDIALLDDSTLLIGGNFAAPFNTYFTRLNYDGSHNGTSPLVDSGAFIKDILKMNDLVFIGGIFDGVNTVLDFPNCGALTSSGDLVPPELLLPDVSNNSINSIDFSDQGSLFLGGTDGVTGTVRKLDYDPIAEKFVEDDDFNTHFMTDLARGYISFIQVNVVKTDKYGRVYVGGQFRGLTDIRGNSHSGILRLTRNGYIDPNFQIDFTGANPKVHDIKIQKNGKILFGGIFTYLNGYINSPESSNGILRVYENGSIDWEFNKFAIGTGYDTPGEYATIFSIAVREYSEY
jgi:Domain of unknown function (DUF5122) beta-propeller